MRLTFGILLSLLLAAPAFARPLQVDDHAALEKTVATFVEAMKTGDHKQVIDTVPPRIISSVADKVDMSESQLRDAMVKQTATVMAQAKVKKFDVDLSNVDACDAKMADGSTVTYAFVPASTQLIAGGQAVRSQQNLLVLREAGIWYLMRMADAQQQQMLQIAYPFFAKPACKNS